jgi:hypothetical protein
MNKLALSVAISTIIASPAFALDYTSVATSGTAADPMASIVVQAGASTSVFYVDNASGTASNTTTPAIQLVKSGDWTFDFTNPAAVTFTGNIAYGDYKTQTNVTGTPTINGRQTFVGVNQAFSGVGTFDAGTNTFTYSYLNPTVNGGGGSVQTQTSSSCANGQTSVLGKVCTSFATATPAWEGLALNFVFSADKTSFSGSLAGTDTSGSGLSSNTTTINWQIAGSADAPAVPVPAAAWLFGSSLIGLAATARRRAKKS